MSRPAVAACDRQHRHGEPGRGDRPRGEAEPASRELRPGCPEQSDGPIRTAEAHSVAPASTDSDRTPTPGGGASANALRAGSACGESRSLSARGPGSICRAMAHRVGLQHQDADDDHDGRTREPTVAEDGVQAIEEVYGLAARGGRRQPTPVSVAAGPGCCRSRESNMDYCGLAGRPLVPTAVTPMVEAVARAAAAALWKKPANPVVRALRRTAMATVSSGRQPNRSLTASTESRSDKSSTT